MHSVWSSIALSTRETPTAGSRRLAREPPHGRFSDAVRTLATVLPTIVALIRGHCSIYAIGFVNVVLGWSVIGWLWAMIWALSGRHVPLGDGAGLSPLGLISSALG